MKKIILLCLLVVNLSAHAEQEHIIPVLMYHHTTNTIAPAPTSITLTTFEQHLQMLQREKYTTITVSQLTDFMLGKIKLPKKTVALTFDDGWRDNLEAAGLMEKYKVRGTFFVCSSFVEHSTNLSEQDIHDLSTNPLFEIGAHSHTHFTDWSENLDKLDTRLIVGEVVISKQIIEQITQKPVNSFAWPYGHYSDDLIQYAQYIGFTSTLTVDPRSDNRVGASPLKIKRITVDGNCTAAHLKTMVETGTLVECK